jgi:CDP-diacylglycerol--glycerol-3-phosphate 3-phosphatidyltransferase
MIFCRHAGYREVMASIYDLKPAFQNLLRPLVSRLARAGVTANQITLLALALSCACGALIASFPQRRWPLLLLPAAMLVRMALNAIDGMLAREHDMKTALGGFLNDLCDVLSDAGMYLPLALVPGVAAAPVVAFTVLAGMTEMAGVTAASLGASRRYDGPMGKSDRAFAVGALGLLLGIGVKPGQWIGILMTALAVLSAVTIVRRVRGALRELKPA